MSGEAIKWFLSMEDRLSPSASSAEKKLAELEHRMRSFRKAADETTDPALQKRLASKLAGMGVDKIEALAALDRARHESISFVATLDHGLSLMERLGHAAVYVGDKIAGWSKDAIGLAGAKEREFISFKNMLRDGPAAKELMEKLERIASNATFSDDQALGMGRRLLAGGFKADEIPTFIKALGDAAGATGASVDKVEDAIGAMRRINAEGVLTAKTMRVLEAAGVPASGVYAVLAKDLHTTAEKARELVKAGKVDSAEGLWAAVKATRDVRSRGFLGSAGADAVAESSDVLMSKIKAKWEDNFAGLWETKGFSKWKGFLGNLNKSLDVTSESGKRLNTSISGAFDNLLGGVFGEVAGPNGLKGTSELVEKLAHGIDALGIAAGGFGKGLLKGLDPALGKLGLLGDGPLDPEKAKLLAGEFEKLGVSIGHAVELAGKLIGEVGKLLGGDEPKGPSYQHLPDGMVQVTTRHQGKNEAGDTFKEPSFWKWVTGQSTDADWGVAPTPAPRPSTTAAQIANSRSSSVSGTVHQEINIHGAAAVDPKAIGDATRRGQRAALDDTENSAAALGAYRP